MKNRFQLKNTFHSPNFHETYNVVLLLILIIWNIWAFEAFILYIVLFRSNEVSVFQCEEMLQKITTQPVIYNHLYSTPSYSPIHNMANYDTIICTIRCTSDAAHVDGFPSKVSLALNTGVYI